jgi:hypothetical protein
MMMKVQVLVIKLLNILLILSISFIELGLDIRNLFFWKSQGIDVFYALKFYNFDANFFASISLLISEFLLLYHVLIPVKMFNIKTNQTVGLICLASFICLLFLGLAKYIINLYSIILVFIIGVLLIFSSLYRPVK